MSIKSMHFKSEKAEELLSVLVLQHKQNGKYSFAIPEFPVMKESYVHSMEEKWKMIHKQQRDAHFEEVKDYTISSDFENQDYLPWRVSFNKPLTKSASYCTEKGRTGAASRAAAPPSPDCCEVGRTRAARTITQSHVLAPPCCTRSSSSSARSTRSSPATSRSACPPPCVG